MQNKSYRIILFLLKVSLFLTVIFFLGGTPSSLRGFYYVLWIYFCYKLYRKGNFLPEVITKRPLGKFFTYVALGVFAIIAEETIASISVNILTVHSLAELMHYILGYYANNLLLLPGFIVAWYVLIKKYYYSKSEIFTLVGIFGVLSEKIYTHLLANPLVAIAILLPTMFTYIGIIMFPLATLQKEDYSTKIIPPFIKYTLGICLPFIVSIPFIIIHTLFAKAGIIDPEILKR